MELFRLFGTIGLQGVEETQDDIEDTTEHAERAEPRMTSAFKRIGQAVVTYFAVDKIVEFGKSIVDASATVSAEASAFEQIMGDYSEEAQKKLKEVADATGVVDTRLTGHMTSLTAKFKGLGYSVDEATTLASDGLMLASDASAFWDKSLEDSMSALNSFINGSYEGGEAIGLFANDTQLASYAVKNGIVSETKEWANLDEARKQATRLEYAKEMMKMSGATGQASKEADQYANVQANLTEKWRQFKAEIGEPLLQNIVLPAMNKLSDIVDKVSQGYKDLTKWVSENKDTIKIAVGVIASATMGLIAYKGAMTAMAIVKSVTKWLDGMTLSQKLLNIAMSMNPIGLVIAGITALVTAFIYFWNTSEEFRNFWIGLWKTIKQAIGDAIAFIEPILQSIWDTMVSVWNGISTTISSVMSAIWTTISTIWGAIKSTIETVLTVILAIIGTIWYAIDDTVLTVMNAIWNTITTIWNAISNTISTVINGIKSIVSTVWNTIESVTTTIWNGIKNAIEVPLNNVKSIVSSVVNGIKSTVSNVWNAIKSVTTSVWNSVKNAITSPMETAKNLVKGIIDSIKGFFNFTFTWPKIPLPHFSIKPKGWEIGDLLKGKLPSLGIEWYAKGGIMNDPTVFGINGNRLMVGGEAGAEAIAPIDTLLGYVRTAVREENANVGYYVQKLIDMLATYFPQIVDGLDRPIVLDDGTLVSRMAQPMDEKLGEINKGRGRGR